MQRLTELLIRSAGPGRNRRQRDARDSRDSNKEA
jgi:hypothetical protein